jgi:hypothetical protein
MLFSEYEGLLNKKESPNKRMMKADEILFTPLERPAACSGDEGNFLMGANTGLMPCVSHPVRWPKVF